MTRDLQHTFPDMPGEDGAASSYRPEHADASGPMTGGDF